MRQAAMAVVLCTAFVARGADLESRVLTHYVPQDLLETMVRTEGWTELPLNVKAGVRKGDVVRIWAGGSIDWCNGDQPGENTSGPAGLGTTSSPLDVSKLALSPDPGHAFAVLFKTESPGHKKCLPPGKPLEIPLTNDKERVWFGFNDLQGRFMDNHLGKGRRHELDPLWMRVEVVRIIVD